MERSLGEPDSEDKNRERLKTVDSDRKENQISEQAEKNKAELYQHIKENEKSDAETLDIATEEQAAKTKPFEDEKTKANENEMDEDMPIELDDMEIDKDDVPKLQTTGQINKKSQPPNSLNKDENFTGENEENKGDSFETKGEKLPTLGAQRGPESTIHTRHDLWSASSLLAQRTMELPSISLAEATLPTEEAQKCWRFCDHTVAPLVQELCEQLRLVLEPTKTAKMKGDYRTGKRLNMRKVSGF